MLGNPLLPNERLQMEARHADARRGRDTLLPRGWEALAPFSAAMVSTRKRTARFRTLSM